MEFEWAVTDTTASVNRARLAYDVTGSGPTVVLISGGGTLDRRMWDGQMAALSLGHRVVRYDIRGIGASSRPTEPFSHSDDLYALLRSLDISRPYIIGLSFGAAIAIDLALDYPDAVGGLILAAPGLSNEKDENVRAAQAAAAMARTQGLASVVASIVGNRAILAAADDAVRERVKAIYLDNAHVFESDFALIRLWRPVTPPANQRLSSLRVPTLIIVGDHDSEHARRTADTLASGIPGAALSILQGAGHLVNLDAPEQFNAAVLQFLAAAH